MPFGIDPTLIKQVAEQIDSTNKKVDVLLQIVSAIAVKLGAQTPTDAMHPPTAP